MTSLGHWKKTTTGIPGKSPISYSEMKKVDEKRAISDFSQPF